MRLIQYLLIAVAFATIGFVSYRHYELTRTVDVLSLALKKEMEETKVAIQKVPCPTVFGDSRSWGPLQAKLKDCVVQVFSEVAEFNWLEPYKSPAQYGTSGSAFFINEEGQLITNAHVVDQARMVTIQIPTFGKRRFDVHVLGVSSDRDLALIELNPKDLEIIKNGLKKIPVLRMGDSDLVHRAEEIMAIGYPLGQESLKSTTGVVSGRQHIGGQHRIQIDAAINPGSSGGPSVNCHGEVVGVNSSGMVEAQNVGYIIPSNEVKLFLKQLSQMPETQDVKFLRKPYLGILFNPASEGLTKFLGNPEPGGLYVAGTQKGSPLHKAGVQQGDMIYSIDGFPIDLFGEMNMPWSEDRISVIDYISRLMPGDKVNLEIYRNGKKRPIKLTFQESELAPIRRMYPAYEKIDYENIGGLVVMPLALNHLPTLVQVSPELTQYMEIQNQLDGALIITHVFPSSAASRSRTLGVGSVIKELNGVKVKTLDDFRSAIQKSLTTGFLTIKTKQNIFVVLPFDRIMEDEPRLARSFFYSMTPMAQKLIEAYSHEAQKTA